MLSVSHEGTEYDGGKKKKGALFNAGDKNQPHFTKYPMSLVKGEEIRSMTCGSICAEIC